MSGALQAIYQNQRSFAPPLPAIGSAYEGGYFAGQISTTGNGIATHNLVVGPKASAESGTNLKWKLVDTLTTGTSSVIDGPTNSSNMNNVTHPAGQFCENLTIGGFTDWYLPAKNEMEVCYYNLKPDGTSNNTSSGINANAVPARASNYANLGPPNQTSAALFQTPAAEAFANTAAYYWNSTQLSASYAWRQYFDTGQQYAYFSKAGTARVRAIRRVAV